MYVNLKEQCTAFGLDKLIKNKPNKKYYLNIDGDDGKIYK